MKHKFTIEYEGINGKREFANTDELLINGENIEDIKKSKIDVLNKIKSEITELRSRQNVGVLECLNILDKYRAERDDKK